MVNKSELIQVHKVHTQSVCGGRGEVKGIAPCNKCKTVQCCLLCSPWKLWWLSQGISEVTKKLCSIMGMVVIAVVVILINHLIPLMKGSG